MASPRSIDRAPAPLEKPKEVKVLCLGFSRTGTMSLKEALITLGYNPYHMSEAAKNCRNGHLIYWNEALDAKLLGKGAAFTKEDFSKFLGNYDAFEDIPFLLFADEFLEMYPDAKVILTNRDTESWLTSMEKTFFEVMGWKTLPILCRFDKVFWGPYMQLVRRIVAQWTTGGKYNREELRTTFLDHYAHIRKIVPKERLLEFQSKDGWGPLCAFLGKQVPEEPYPRVNDAASTTKVHSFIFYLTLVRLLKKPLIGASVVGVVIGLWKWWH